MTLLIYALWTSAILSVLFNGCYFVILIADKWYDEQRRKQDGRLYFEAVSRRFAMQWRNSLGNFVRTIK